MDYLDLYIVSSLLIYLVLIAYTVLLTLRFQKMIYEKYPDDAHKYLGLEKYWGINKKQGLLFLFDENINRLIKDEKYLVNLRKKVIFCYIVFIILMFAIVLIPIAVLLILGNT